jgi:hypothetical protein
MNTVDLKEDKGVIVPVRNIIPGINLDSLVENGEDPGVGFDGSELTDTQTPGVISNARSVWSSNFVSEINYRYDEDVKRELESLRGQVVVDLGAGETLFGYAIADNFGAKGYVGIEPIFAEKLVREVEKEKHNGTPIAVVKEDMLNFLRRLPGDSVSLLCSGIDGDIIPEMDYREATAREIARVLDPEGVYVGHLYPGHIVLPEVEEIDKKLVDRQDGAFLAYRKK